MELNRFTKSLSTRVLGEEVLYGFINNFNSKETRKAYTRDLKDYLEFLKKEFPDIRPLKARHAHIVRYREYLLERDLSPRTVVKKLACVKSFYDYLGNMDLIEHNPAARVKRPKFDGRIKTQDLTNEQIEKAERIFDLDKPSHKLHYALFIMFFKTGLRHSAIANLKFKDLIYIDDKLCFEYDVKGKGRDVKPLTDEMKSAIGDYLSWCESQGDKYPMGENDYIFRPTSNKFGSPNKKLQPGSIIYIFKKIQKELGIKGKITPHSARASVAGRLIETEGVSIYDVAQYLNHSSIDTTSGYIKRKRALKDSLIHSL